VKNEQCRTIQQKCCDPVQAPACEIHIEALSVPCTPGVVGGLQPDPSQNCAWQECRAEGSCFLCDSVAIRLAKKLDREFVNSTFYSLELGIGIGLVSYGTSVQSSTEPQGPGGSGALYNEISGYNANKNETCMACAIGRAVQMVAPSGSDKKYIVLMSDGDANIRDNYAGTDRNGDCIVDAKDDAIARACDAYAQHGIVFYTIGFGSQGGESTLMQISNCSGSEGRYYHGETPEELADIYQNIARQISSARLDRSNTVYGSQSMKLDSTQEPPEASSDRFGIYAAPGEEYEISFYRKLDLTGGVLDFRMYFYNSSGGLAGEFLHEYSNATSDQAFQKDVFQVAVPNGSVEASIGFQFVNASGEIRVDDMYFGPPVACIKEADGYRCGDLLIRKVSNDGDFYPYFSKDGINPKSTVTIKDANCKGSCEYKIFTTSTVLTEDVNCNSGFQL
jgi:hypothetical protein